MPRLLLALTALLVLLPACGSDEPDVTVDAAPSETDVRLAEATAAAAEAEARLAEATAASGAEATDTPDSGSATTGTAPAREIDVPGAGNPDGPVQGEAVCDALKPALTAMRVNALDLDLYASETVILELREDTSFRDPVTGESTPEDVSAWAEREHPGTCSLSSGGDAWYRLTLTPLTGGRGDYATAIEMTTSYAEGGP